MYVTQVFVNQNAANARTTAALALSPDPEQQFIYVADPVNGHIHVLDRKTLELLDSFGERGVESGELGGVHHIATDSQGNLYTAEVLDMRRVQKFVFTGTQPAQ